MSEPPFPSPWPVSTDNDVGAFKVRVPGLTAVDRLTNDPKWQDGADWPKYLRLHMRRPGVRGKLWFARRFVLEVDVIGANNPDLTVSSALSAWCPPRGERIQVSVANQGNFDRSRLMRESTAQAGAIGVPVGGAIAAASAAMPAAAPALVIGGSVVTGLGLVAMFAAAWRTRRR